ncbi:MAG: hypothetical protein AAF430_22850 [Myxococcota bacterium]
MNEKIAFRRPPLRHAASRRGESVTRFATFQYNGTHLLVDADEYPRLVQVLDMERRDQSAYLASLKIREPSQADQLSRFLVYGTFLENPMHRTGDTRENLCCLKNRALITLRWSASSRRTCESVLLEDIVLETSDDSSRSAFAAVVAARHEILVTDGDRGVTYFEAYSETDPLSCLLHRNGVFFLQSVGAQLDAKAAWHDRVDRQRLLQISSEVGSPIESGMIL